MPESGKSVEGGTNQYRRLRRCLMLLQSMLLVLYGFSVLAGGGLRHRRL
jgi:hypothetical protein